MIGRLRLRLILASLAALFIVLSLIIGVGTGLSYKNLVDEADRTLDILADNGGEFPLPGPERPRPEGESSPPWRESPELPFEARYFAVAVAPDGSIGEINLERIYSVDEEGAAEYAMEVLATGRERGFRDTYRYLVRIDGASKVIYFLSAWQNLRALRRFFLSASLAALLGITAVGVLIAIFSSRIVRPIAESYELQRRFVTDAGHDIKTPLAIIRADAEILEMDLGEDNEWLRDILTQTARLTGLTDELITLSRMDEIRTLAMEEVSLTDIVRDADRSFRGVALSKGLRFDEKTEEEVFVLGDRQMLERLMDILLDNAVKYSSPSGQVQVRLCASGSAASLSVTNDTDSLSSEDIPHLFERFYRADKSRSSSGGGYGIGLSIANSIALAHKARIVASSAGEGTLTISVTFRRTAPGKNKC